MIGFAGGLLLLAAVGAAAPQEPPFHRADAQYPLPPDAIETQPPPRKLQGRFLHITGTAPSFL